MRQNLVAGLKSVDLRWGRYMSMISIFKILKQLMVKYSTLDNLHLFSDSAAQHFKQRFFLNGVTMLAVALDKEDINFTITYDQFATSHGKGALGGIGEEGALKRGVMAKVVSRQTIVRTLR